jgi:hypothetical protein
VLPLNGGAPAGSAGEMEAQLKQAGYVNTAPADDWEGHTQDGNSVLCKPGLEREAVALAVAVGEGTPTQPFPDPPPPGSENVDCVVVVGAPAG